MPKRSVVLQSLYSRHILLNRSIERFQKIAVGICSEYKMVSNGIRVQLYQESFEHKLPENASPVYLKSAIIIPKLV